MHYVTDLHLHSKYSRAVSPQMNLKVMATYAREKGINILTTGDFTHPVWSKEIRSELVEEKDGLYMLQESDNNSKPVSFVLSTEISSIYKQGDKLRRIHNLIFVPHFDAAEKFTRELVKRGCNLNADGRPIVGLSSKNLLELLLSVDERGILIPCHVWTPHFGVYGSASGFASLQEAFGDLEKYIFGVETGISSDPGMNWQIAELEHRSILSFSDAHSPAKMGREATVIELNEVSYGAIREAIIAPYVIASRPQAAKQSKGQRKSSTFDSPRSPRNDQNHIVYTLEFYPEEGKYHYSGHRNCKVALGPEEIKTGSNICSICRKRLTEGVLYRVQELSDPKLMDRILEQKDTLGVTWFSDKNGIQPPYVKLVPLLEIVAESLDSTVASQKTKLLYSKLCTTLGSEIQVLLYTSVSDIEKVGGGRVAEGVAKVRAGKIAIEPGYDGEYGKVRIWRKGEQKASIVPQLSMDF